MAEFATSIVVDAPPERVFDHLVTAEGLTAWMGRNAVLDPRPGGEFSVDVAGYAVRGRFLHVERPHRVVLTWGMAGVPDLPPGGSRVEFRLVPVDGGTRVDLTHTGLPDEHVAGHRDGWTHFGARLRIVAGGGNPGHDDWIPRAVEQTRPVEET